MFCIVYTTVLLVTFTTQHFFACSGFDYTAAIFLSEIKNPIKGKLSRLVTYIFYKCVKSVTIKDCYD